MAPFSKPVYGKLRFQMFSIVLVWAEGKNASKCMRFRFSMDATLEIFVIHLVWSKPNIIYLYFEKERPILWKTTGSSWFQRLFRNFCVWVLGFCQYHSYQIPEELAAYIWYLVT